ncbi:putative quinol monooxygenase [Salipiger mucosus]|uniref:Arginase/agmatinase/formimionoglutamate hydrolase n=1 Tax=Salipiger mucosus DSM 16094 TaxID=1123237 RepID=S9Q871_9RHOB|nr:antibiotic biosynthesis monooxygenase [Salipiger mucosus]EPX76202.1 Arginase/agmatinase/formimionoglutamate hydrolase [Salipiger mucosus DSM 16094]
MTRIRLRGTLTCPPEDAPTLRAALPDHIRLTRAEPGCLRFDVTETVPGTFTVDELFTDRAALDAHQVRNRASEWYRLTAGYPRDYAVEEA